PRKAKGTVRPQQGLEYLSARLIEAGIIRPPRQLARLHQRLIDEGAARYFGADLEGPWRALREADAVARRVRLLLGFDHLPLDSPPIVWPPVTPAAYGAADDAAALPAEHVRGSASDAEACGPGAARP